MNLYIALSSMKILTILVLPIQEHASWSFKGHFSKMAVSNRHY